jgi:ABC-type transport system substrate-binding protein
VAERALDINAAKNDPRVVAKAYTGVWNYFAAVDHTNPLFKEARVRQALSLSVDRRRILGEQWGYYGVIVNSPINPSLPAFDKKIPAPEYDPVKAKTLLAEAGWHPGKDGVLEKDGKRFTFSIVTFAGPAYHGHRVPGRLEEARPRRRRFPDALGRPFPSGKVRGHQLPLAFRVLP